MRSRHRPIGRTVCARRWSASPAARPLTAGDAQGHRRPPHVFERYNIVSDGNLREPSRRLGNSDGHSFGHITASAALPAKRHPQNPQENYKRRGGGVVDGGGLENRCTLTGTRGSNPFPSAIRLRSPWIARELPRDGFAVTMRSRRSAKREGGRIPSPPPKSLNGQLFSCSGRAAAGPATGRALGQVANRSQTSRSGVGTQAPVVSG